MKVRWLGHTFSLATETAAHSRAFRRWISWQTGTCQRRLIPMQRCEQLCVWYIYIKAIELKTSASTSTAVSIYEIWMMDSDMNEKGICSVSQSNYIEVVNVLKALQTSTRHRGFHHDLNLAFWTNPLEKEKKVTGTGGARWSRDLFLSSGGLLGIHLGA